MKNILALILFVLISVCLYSQTTTVDYSYKTLNSNCNVFSTELTIDNVKHQSTKGSPKFDVINFFVKLACQKASSGQILGTEYQIIYPFKKNYRYQISVQYQGTVANTQTELYPSVAVKLNVTKKSQNTGCSGPVAVALSDYDNFAPSGSSLTWITNIIDGTMTVDHESLSIAALPWTGSTTGVQQVMIRKIQIIEILPALVNDNHTGAINLTPSSSNGCGTQVDGTTVNATQSPQPSPSCNDKTEDDVWYKFVATDSRHSINLSNVSFQGSSSGLDGYGIAVYNSSLNLVECTARESKLVTNTFIVGQTYYIRLWTTSNNPSRRMSFKICISKPLSNFIKSLSWTNGPNGSRIATANYVKDPGIPLSDITFVWSLSAPQNADYCGGNGLNIVSAGANQAYLYTLMPDCAAHVNVRMKRISTNTYISDLYTTWNPIFGWE